MARLRREKIMAQMSEMQKHFINENKELFQQSLEELEASTSAAAAASDNRWDGLQLRLEIEAVDLYLKVRFSTKKPLQHLQLLGSSSSSSELTCTSQVCVGPRRVGGADSRQLVTCILCQEEQEVRGHGRAMVLAAFVQRSTVLSKNRRRGLPNPGDLIRPCGQSAAQL